MISSRLAFLRFLALALTAVALTAGSLVVIERLGVPSRALTVGAAVVALLLAAIAGLASGTMRLPLFLTQARALPPAGVSLATAILVPFGLPGQPALGVAAGLGLAAFLLGPALRRSGAPTWPCFLAARFSSPVLRVASAVVLSAAAIGLGAAALGHAVDAIERVFAVPRAQAAAIGSVVLACMAVPGGSRSQTRTAVALGLVVLACAGALWFGREASSPERLVAMLSPITRPGGLAVGVAAALSVLAFPAYQTIWPGLDRPADIRIALLWAAVLVAVLAYAAGPAGPQPDGIFSAIAAELLAMTAGLAAAGALLLAAGQGIGFDLRPRIDRRRTPTSARFAQMRLATLVVIGLAGLAVARFPHIAATQAGAASALTLGALLAPILLGVAWSRANAAGALAALGAGLAATLALIDGRVGPTELGPSAAGLVGCAVGLTAGVAATLFSRKPSQTPRPLADDML